MSIPANYYIGSNDADETVRQEKAAKREKTIVRTSFVGIGANIFLAAFKLAIGLISGSIAVVNDAVNNFSDALSSVVTIIGTKLAGKRPDKKHPMGYGRIEYLSALIIAVIVLYAGITAAVESVKKIICPETTDYSIISLVIIGVAVAVKIILGLYVSGKGKETGSDSLKASGKDALFDAILSSSVLASALVFVLTGLSLESYVGVLISVFIIKSGVEMLVDTLNKILGERAETGLTVKIKQLLGTLPGVRGAYDLVMNSDGPDKTIASVHLEVPENMTAPQIDALSRQAQDLILTETGVLLTAVGIYSYNTSDTEDGGIYSDIRSKVLAHEGVLQIHGLYVDRASSTARFDVVVSFEADARELLQKLQNEMKASYPEFDFIIVGDVDVSD